jgi:hypothetical protein
MTKEPSLLYKAREFSVVYPHHVDADPDADPDSTHHSDADSDFYLMGTRIRIFI